MRCESDGILGIWIVYAPEKGLAKRWDYVSRVDKVVGPVVW